ncbi:MAG: hypothetical protein FD170_1066 [Bacteroidetes bacterium]|nr:MAG: hypothetical protein FD170_1066 [Bacteroidota bacterium]
MNKRILFFLSFALLSALIGCDRNKKEEDKPEPFVRLLKDLTVQSSLLNRAINYAVLLPPEYENSTDSFPVVYLLHGFGDNEKAWYQGGNIQFYADKYALETGPVIYVMPQGFNTYWVNKYNGNYPYMDMLVNELLPEVDAKFRTRKDPAQRAVMGYSMGGYGALILPAKNPEVFKTAVALSMSFRTDQQYINEPQGVFDSQWGPIFGGIGAAGNARLTSYFENYSPFHFFENPDDPALSGQNYFIDCGDDEESLSETNNSLHIVLRNLGINHEYRVRNGAHSWDYWHKSLPEAFRFMGYAFRNINFPDDPEELGPSPIVPDTQITEWQLPETDFSYNVVVPESYSSETRNYPVVYVLHSRETGSETIESEQLLALLNNNIKILRLPKLLIVEIPLQENEITGDVWKNIITEVKQNYRTYPDGKYAVVAGNLEAGKKAWELMPEMTDQINACLLFDATLPENAIASGTGISFYLDITDKSENYKGYHSLYMNIRQNEIPYEYRVRQGVPTHDNFLSGLSEASVFIKDNLKK